MKTHFSETDINSLNERISTYLLNGENYKVIEIISQTINEMDENNPYLPSLLDYRATMYSELRDWESAIKDMKKCISLFPGVPGFYLQLGVYLTWKHFYSGNFRIDGDIGPIEESIFFYKECLRYDPKHTTAWLNVIETYLFIQNWEIARKLLKLCKTYVETEENKLVWAWLNCLSLVMADKPVQEQDIELMLDRTIKYESKYDYKQMDCVLSELERIHYPPDKLKNLKEIHQLFKDCLS